MALRQAGKLHLISSQITLSANHNIGGQVREAITSVFRRSSFHRCFVKPSVLYPVSPVIVGAGQKHRYLSTGVARLRVVLNPVIIVVNPDLTGN